MTGALWAFAAWKLYRGRNEAAMGLGLAGTVLLICELALPPVSNFLFDRWMQFAQLLGTVNTYLLVTLVFWVVLTPISFLVRQFSRTSARMARECREQGSAWIELPQDLSPDRYRQPY